MTKNNSMNLEGMSYETPSVNVLNVQAEGVLCASYGEAGAAGKDLGEENVWDF